MQKVSIKPKPMSLQQAVRIFDALNPVGREVFYETLSDDEKDALYEQTTDALIGRVHLTTKNRIDAKVNTARNRHRGYLVPDECHTAENNCLWKSASWYVIMGKVSESLKSNLTHMCEHFGALQEAENPHGNTSKTQRNCSENSRR